MVANHKNRYAFWQRLLRAFATKTVVCFVIFPAFCNASDLLSGTEFIESPLSLSLSRSVTLAGTDRNRQISVSQSGIHNNVNITQQANADNVIALNQDGFNNDANLSQSGRDNLILLEQFGSNNQADILQDGNANVVNVKQFGNKTFSVHQIGDEMVVNITQL
mgnify:CR=1 FL=1